jgi:hypothetical protein
LQEEGTIEPVQFADWAAPIVPIVKDDKSIRICGDYKVTVNQAVKLDNYPIPKAEDLFATLSGGEKFTKLDMSQAVKPINKSYWRMNKKYILQSTHTKDVFSLGFSRVVWKTYCRGFLSWLCEWMIFWFLVRMMRNI